MENQENKDSVLTDFADYTNQMRFEEGVLYTQNKLCIMSKNVVMITVTAKLTMQGDRLIKVATLPQEVSLPAGDVVFFLATATQGAEIKLFNASVQRNSLYITYEETDTDIWYRFVITYVRPVSPH